MRLEFVGPQSLNPTMQERNSIPWAPDSERLRKLLKFAPIMVYPQPKLTKNTQILLLSEIYGPRYASSGSSWSCLRDETDRACYTLLAEGDLSLAAATSVTTSLVCTRDSSDEIAAIYVSLQSGCRVDDHGNFA